MKVLKILFNPIFLLAAGLHAGLLMIPIAGGSSEELVPAPDPEGESITVTHIPLKKLDKGSDKTSSATKDKKANAVNAQKKSSSSSKSVSVSSSSNNPQRRTTSRNVNREVSNLATPQTQPTPPPPSSFDNRNRPSPSPAASNSNTPTGNPAPEIPQLLSQADRQTRLARLLEKDNLRNVSADFIRWLAGVNRGYTYNEKGTTDDIVKQAKENWLKALGESAGLVLLEAPDPLEKPLTVSYPLILDTEKGAVMLRRCLTPKPKQGLIGVVVVRDGVVVPDSPTLLRSSGYPLLDDLALQAVQDYSDFPGDEALQAHTVKVDVAYDAKACVSLLKLGIEPLEGVDADETPAPSPGGRNPLEEAEGEITPF